jgi:hypothetical protein
VSPPSRPAFAAFAAFPISALFLLAGCTTDNTLSGSLSDFYHLQFDSVRARLYSSELSIEYVSRATGAVPVRVTLRVREKEPVAGKSFDLEKYGDVTGRLPDGTEIPRFTGGELVLDEYEPELDAPIKGSFDATFRAARDTLSLSGTFEAELEPVPDPGPEPP